jgi:hypothetical protein
MSILAPNTSLPRLIYPTEQHPSFSLIRGKDEKREQKEINGQFKHLILVVCCLAGTAKLHRLLSYFRSPSTTTELQDI